MSREVYPYRTSSFYRRPGYRLDQEVDALRQKNCFQKSSHPHSNSLTASITVFPAVSTLDDQEVEDVFLEGGGFNEERRPPMEVLGGQRSRLRPTFVATHTMPTLAMVRPTSQVKFI